MHESIKDFLKNNKDLLIKNDLKQVYENALNSPYWDSKVRDLTGTLLDVGIDPLDYCDNETFEWCFNELDLNNTKYVLNGLLILPNKIEIINTGTFAWSIGYRGIDLRGIKEVRKASFRNTPIQTLIFDAIINFNNIGTSAFDGTDIKMVVLPKYNANKRIEEFKNSKIFLNSDSFKNTVFETYTP